VANEERVHAGEFQRVLKILLPDEEAKLAEGAAEVDALRAGLNGGEAPSNAPSPAPVTLTVGALRGGAST